MATQHHPTPHDEDGAYEAHTHHPNYVRVYVILLVLLVISILGPEIGIRAVTLITAFGIACVKAWMVAKNFMHINMAPRYVLYLVATTLVFMLLFFAGASPDVMKFSGTRWEKIPVAHVEAASGGHGGAAHH
jgi:caa(3)-type oxidase subunit IV